MPPRSHAGVHLIRHAESMSNAGYATQDPASILLSERGRMQAVRLAESIAEAPDLIVVSPYIRTRLTAEPLCRKFPLVPVEERAAGVEVSPLPPSPHRIGATEEHEQDPARALETVADRRRGELSRPDREEAESGRERHVDDRGGSRHERRGARGPAPRPPDQDEGEPMIGDQRVEGGRRRRGP